MSKNCSSKKSAAKNGTTSKMCTNDSRMNKNFPGDVREKLMKNTSRCVDFIICRTRRTKIFEKSAQQE